MPLAPTPQPEALHADPRRLVFRLPLGILATVTLGAILVLLARLALGPSRGLSNAALASSRIAPVCLLVAGYIRLIYIPRTRLLLDQNGIALRQPFAAWRVAWADVSTITAGGSLDPTSRGGIRAAARLHLKAGGTCVVPDVFAVRGAALQARLTAYKR